MSNLYKLLENALNDIENGLKDGVTVENLAEKYNISEGHLRRLFKLVFKQTLSEYIRLRKLSESLDDILNTDLNILDIALQYSFEYEQSYIRSFKREFDITPGELRKSGHIVKVKPPLNLFDENKLGDGLFFGPDIVMVPQFTVIGKCNKIPFDESAVLAPLAAKQFWHNECALIKNKANPAVYIGLTQNINKDERFSEYLSSVQVKNTGYIPSGLSAASFETALCARFRYIGQHHYYDINRFTAEAMYKAIANFANDEKFKYALAWDKIYFEKIDISLYDGTYCQMEWFTPVNERKSGFSQ